MKNRISVTVEDETIFLLRDVLRNSDKFRNKSHLIENAVKDFCRRVKKDE